MLFNHQARLSGLPLILTLVFGLSLLASPLRAKGQLDIVAKFFNAGIELDVATYHDPAASGRNKIGLLGIAEGSARNSYAFDKEVEYAALFALWTKARQAQADTWTVVGSLKENGTNDAATIILMAGQGVKFTISDSHHATLTYVLARADLDRFENALNRVKDFISN